MTRLCNSRGIILTFNIMFTVYVKWYGIQVQQKKARCRTHKNSKNTEYTCTALHPPPPSPSCSCQRQRHRKKWKTLPSYKAFNNKPPRFSSPLAPLVFPSLTLNHSPKPLSSLSISKTTMFWESLLLSSGFIPVLLCLMPTGHPFLSLFSYLFVLFDGYSTNYNH